MTAVTPKPASLTIDLYLNERTPRLLKRGVFVCRLMVDEYKLSQKKNSSSIATKLGGSK